MSKRNLVKVGEIFNRLTVLKDTKRSNKNGRILLCLCQCGSKIEVIAGCLRSGNTQSCGCLRQETSKENGNKTKKHGQAGLLNKTPEYWTWMRIKQRCNNPNNPSYKNYGAKGIKVYDGWIDNFLSFYEEIGPRPSDKSQIDRINGNKGYEPGNVRWVTPLENNRNRLNNHRVILNGVSKCFSEWIKELGIARSTVYNRIKNGWTESDAFLIPTKGRGIGSRGKHNLL